MIEGAASTVKFATLLGAPVVTVCVEVAPEVLFGFTPGELLVTLKITVQLLFAGILIPLKLSAVSPPAKVAGRVPEQVPVTLPAVADMFTSVSVNDTLVSGIAFELVSVRVIVDVPPD